MRLPSKSGNPILPALALSVFGLVWLGGSRGLGHGALDDRIAELSRRLATNSLDAQLLFERGELHRLHQDWSAAEADFERAAQLRPDWRVIAAARARVFAEAGRTTDALVAYDAYLRQATNDGPAFIERARLRTKLGDGAAARADYLRGIELLTEPGPECFLELAQVEIQLGSPDRALAVLEGGMRKLGPVVSLQMRAVEYEEARGDVPAAVRRLELIIARAHRPETWLAQKGDLLRRAGRMADARVAYEAALGAVAKLPAPLQSAAPMRELKTRIEEALSRFSATNAPVAAGP